MDDLSNIFEEADKYLFRALFRWKDLHPELWDDARQEGMIQVWRDIEAGETVKLKILRRASLVANKYIHRNGEYSFGKPKKSRDGLKSKKSTYEKVQAYLDEVVPILGHWPTAKQVSDATGLGYSNTLRVFRDIREGRVDHMVYNASGRKDWDYYKTVSTESLATSTEDPFTSTWTNSKQVLRYAETFEEDLVANLSFIDILNELNDHHREVLFLHYQQGYTPSAIAQHFNLGSSARGSRHIAAATHQASLIVNPYEGSCSSKHKRSADNTTVVKRTDGSLFRICQDCQVNKGVGAKKKSVTVDSKGKECAKGHGPIDYVDTKGWLRCLTCKREQALRSYNKQKQKRKNEGS